jgi:hypothetical protein
MKKMISLIPAFMICCALTMATAETAPTPAQDNVAIEEPSRIEESADRFLDSVQDTWDAFLGMASDAGDVAREWTEGALNDAGTFLGDRFADVSAWFDEVGSFFSERSSEMGLSVTEAWETLKGGAEQTGMYSQEQLEAAYRTIRDWFRTSGETVEESVLEAVDNIAEAAGVQVEEASEEATDDASVEESTEIE